MTLEQVLNDLKEIEKIINPEHCNILSSYLNGFITEFEDDYHLLNLQVSNEWLRLREQQKSDKTTDRLIEVSDIYQKREKTKLTISQLKRLRSDLKDRFSVLSNLKRY